MLLGFCHAQFACLPECQQVYWAWVTWCLWQETRTGKLALDFALEHSEEYEILQLMKNKVLVMDCGSAPGIKSVPLRLWPGLYPTFALLTGVLTGIFRGSNSRLRLNLE